MFNKLVAWMLPVVPRRVVQGVARRYIAGDDRESALVLAESLQQQGFGTTVDILGEDITEFPQARAAADRYVELVRTLSGRIEQGHVSVKLTQFGLRLDPEACFIELGRVLDAARDAGVFVNLDMEDSTITDETLAMFRRARKRYEGVGTVLQATLRRTLDDAAALGAEGAAIRLCKGIYREPREIAWRRRGEIRDAFVAAARVLLEARGYVALATHDKKLIEALEALIVEMDIPRERLEFQALLGVPIRTTLERLRDEGFRVRLYVPYGDQWYAYSVRRLQENPQMAGAVMGGLFKRDRLDANLTANA